MTDDATAITTGPVAEPATTKAGRNGAIFAAFVLLGLAVAFAAAWVLRDLLILTFLAILFAVLLRSGATLIASHTRLPPTAGVIVVLLALIGILVLAVMLVVPTLVQQGTELVKSLPAAISAVEGRISNTPFLSTAWEQVRSQFNLPDPGAALSQVGSVLSIVAASVSNLVFLLFAALFLALSPATYLDGVRWLVPSAHRGFAMRLLDELGTTLRAWFGGQLLMMLMVGILVWLGLWVIGVPYSLALGVFAGLLEFIPYLGPILGAAPAVLLGFSVSPTLGLWTLGLFVVIGQIEGNVIGPVVQESAVSIPPALLLVFLFGMSQVFGLFGLLVATPLLAVLLVAVRRIYVERILEGIDLAGQTKS